MHKRKPWKIRAKKSYVVKSLTMFSGVCPEGRYKSGALCYKDCKVIGMSNCGIGACARDSKSCGKGI